MLVAAAAKESITVPRTLLDMDRDDYGIHGFDGKVWTASLA